MIMVIPIRVDFKMVLLMVKELLNLTKVGLMKESSSLVKQMAKEN